GPLPNSLPRNAMNVERTARGLGWFSLGLGLTQLLAPVRLGRLIGVGDRRHLMRAMGAREVPHGLAILAPSRRAPGVGARAPGVWSRVAGDALDTGLLAAALAGEQNERGRVAGALLAVLPIGVLDFLTARRLRERS